MRSMPMFSIKLPIKSKFMIIRSSQRLKSLGKISLQICEQFLDRADCYKYLGIDINETLTWSDHVVYISTTVNQRLGILRGIKYLLPMHTRELYIKSMILLRLNYKHIVLGDILDKTPIAEVQLLQNKTAKSILDKANPSSATEAITEPDWLVLYERQWQHRLSFVCKCLQGLIDWEFNSTHLRDNHPYNTRHKDNFKMPKSRCQRGHQRITYQAIHEWNALPISTRNFKALIHLRSLYKLFYLFNILSTLS